MKKKLFTYGAIGLSGLIVLAVAIFLIAFLNRGVVVPKVISMTLTEATEALEDAGFKVKVDMEYSKVLMENIVISQNTEPGTKVKVGSEITIVVSKGEDLVTVPNVQGYEPDAAKAALIKLGFTVKTKEEFSNYTPKGKIMSQSVMGGREAKRGAQIIITISKGADLVTVPNIKGMTYEKAKALLDKAGLKLKTETAFNGSVKEGLIISQDVAAKKQVSRDTTITAKISAGVSNTKGTTPSNAADFGRVTKQGNWIYFSSEEGGIYRMRTDKSKTEFICNEYAVSLNVVGEWMYYCDGVVGGIYKIKTDGTGKVKLSDITSYRLYVEDGWIYYTGQFWTGMLYKMDTNGKSVTKIVSEECNCFIVHKGYIYYIDRNSTVVYKCRTNGEGKSVLCAGFSGSEMTLAGDRIVTVKSHRFQSVKLDGSNMITWGTQSVAALNINGCDGWIYYLESDYRTDEEKTAFYKIKPDGTGKTKIYDYEHLSYANFYVNVVDGWIYFPNEHEFSTMYRVRINGKNFERVG